MKKTTTTVREYDGIGNLTKETITVVEESTDTLTWQPTWYDSASGGSLPHNWDTYTTTTTAA